MSEPRRYTYHDIKSEFSTLPPEFNVNSQHENNCFYRVSEVELLTAEGKAVIEAVRQDVQHVNAVDAYNNPQKFEVTEIQNPDKWEISDDWRVIECPSPEIGKEISRRWNGYEQLKKALRHIQKHVETSIPTGYKLSGIWNIAEQALLTCEDRNETKND
jgi:hypothetical protein